MRHSRAATSSLRLPAAAGHADRAGNLGAPHRPPPLPSPGLPRPPPSTPYQADDGGAGEGGGRWFSGGSDGVGAEWVACLVCGEFIRRTDYCVNAHLDICITRGAKRKLTQSTLLDFRFSKRTTAEPALDSLNNDDEAENMEPIDRDVSGVRAFFLTNSDTGNSKGTATPLSPGCLHGSLDISKTCNTSIPSNTVLANVKNAATDDAVEKGSSCMLPTGTTSGSIDACAGTDSSTTVAVGTVIVGRRFHENIELQESLGVTVLRDPQNAKDPDVINVSIFCK